MASQRRVEKVNVLLREIVARILVEELATGGTTMITVTRAAASDDLYYATVFVSILAPSADEGTTAFAELKRMTGSVQYRLNRELRMRPVPKITFAIDKEEERRERVEKLLSEDRSRDN